MERESWGALIWVSFRAKAGIWEPYLISITTLPGSMAFYLWEATDLPFNKLLDEMISLAFKRQRSRDALQFSFDTNLLSTVSLGGAKGAKGGKL